MAAKETKTLKITLVKSTIGAIPKHKKTVKVIRNVCFIIY